MQRTRCRATSGLCRPPSRPGASIPFAYYVLRWPPSITHGRAVLVAEMRREAEATLHAAVAAERAKFEKQLEACRSENAALRAKVVCPYLDSLE